MRRILGLFLPTCDKPLESFLRVILLPTTNTRTSCSARPSTVRAPAEYTFLQATAASAEEPISKENQGI